MKHEKPDIECTSLELFWKDIRKSLGRKVPASQFILPLILAGIFSVVLDGLVDNSILTTITFALVFFVYFFIEDNRLEKEELKRDKETTSTIENNSKDEE